MSGATLSIDRLNARYLVAVDSDERGRLDRLLGLVLETELEPAVERAAAVGTADLVCVRRVDTSVRFALDGGADGALATAWAGAIAAAVAERVRGGGHDVVRFGSRRHALADMALGLAAGDHEREWAWRALGLWPATEPAAGRALLSALVQDGGAGVVPVLVAVARARRIGGLAAILAPGAWLTLAAAALHSAGAVDATIGAALRGGGDPASDAAVARRALQRSTIAATLRASGAPAVAVAALALVETQPATVAALGERLADALAAQLAPRERSDPPQGAGDAPAADGLRHGDGGGDQPGHDGPPGGDEDAPLPLPERARGSSDFGGLVFALHAVVALDLATRLLRAPGDPTLPSALLALALALVDTEPADAAALAFAGLPPDADPPAAPDDEALPTIAAAAHDVHHWIAARMDVDPAELALPALLRRRAEIVADPGWIETHLLHDEVDTATRRAGLDLDPGHLPFLGCVVRIVYG